MGVSPKSEAPIVFKDFRGDFREAMKAGTVVVRNYIPSEVATAITERLLAELREEKVKIKTGKILNLRDTGTIPQWNSVVSNIEDQTRMFLPDWTSEKGFKIYAGSAIRELEEHKDSALVYVVTLSNKADLTYEHRKKRMFAVAPKKETVELLPGDLTIVRPDIYHRVTPPKDGGIRTIGTVHSPLFDAVRIDQALKAAA